MADDTIVQQRSSAAPEIPAIWTKGVSRMSLVSPSVRRNSRFSGKARASVERNFMPKRFTCGCTFLGKSAKDSCLCAAPCVKSRAMSVRSHSPNRTNDRSNGRNSAEIPKLIHRKRKDSASPATRMQTHWRRLQHCEARRNQCQPCATWQARPWIARVGATFYAGCIAGTGSSLFPAPWNAATFRRASC